ncbi:MAG: magnesium transporter CorA family protein [Sandaracinobacteroides sp.]
MLRLHLPDCPTDALTAEMVASGGDAVRPLPDADHIRRAVWIDLAFPLGHEREAIERALDIVLPKKADMTAIEASSRVYRDGKAHVMNVLLVVGTDSGSPAAIPVSLILMADRLVTVRYADPMSFRTLDESCVRFPPGANPQLLLMRLFENVVDRTADILEHMGAEMDSLSALVFGRDRPNTARLSTEDLQVILRRIGNVQFVLNKVHDSLVTLSRATSSLQLSHVESSGEIETVPGIRPDKLLRESLKSIIRDFASLSENSTYLTQHAGFLLDAALGRISIEQNAIVKIFSVAAVIFLPPTLVGTIYGMNFEVMPELGWTAGYPFALALMVLSAVLPYLYFKRRGWL